MQLTFEMLPDAVSQMFCKLENIERLLQRQTPNPTPQSDDLLTIKQAAGILDLSVPTIYGLVSRRQIPCMKKGKRLYFSKQELNDWIKSGRKPTFTEVDKEADIFLSHKIKRRAI